MDELDNYIVDRVTLTRCSGLVETNEQTEPENSLATISETKIHMNMNSELGTIFYNTY